LVSKLPPSIQTFQAGSVSAASAPGIEPSSARADTPVNSAPRVDVSMGGMQPASNRENEQN